MGFNCVRSLLRGQMGPMSSEDVSEWEAYFRVKAERAEEYREESEHKRKASDMANKAAMGQFR